jgi:hypothetical protein
MYYDLVLILVEGWNQIWYTSQNVGL